MKKRMMFVAGLALVLAGCQTQDEGRNSSASSASINTEASTSNSASTNSSTNEETAAIGEDLPLNDTQYGRGAASDGADTNEEEEATRILTADSKSIIIYFSRSGNTENLARMIHNENQADVLELAVENPYPADYEEAVERANEERENQDYPEISTEIPDFGQYDRIYLGYQTWSMTLSHPITSFLMDHGEEFNGKTIYPFSTNAGYGEGDTLERIGELAPGATIAESFEIQDEDLLANQDQVIAWVADSES
ncbi:hypothetical protein ACEVR1_000797 [Listeria monocytogenes]|nr:hypothetical protein [Listeria monocytogenes]